MKLENLDSRWKMLIRYHCLKTGCKASDHNHCNEVIFGFQKKMGDKYSRLNSGLAIDVQTLLQSAIDERCSCNPNEHVSFETELYNAGWGDETFSSALINSSNDAWLEALNNCDPFDNTLIYLSSIEGLHSNKISTLFNHHDDKCHVHTQCSRLNFLANRNKHVEGTKGSTLSLKQECLLQLNSISLWADGKLNFQKEGELLAHFKTCPPCKKFAKLFANEFLEKTHLQSHLWHH